VGYGTFAIDSVKLTDVVIKDNRLIIPGEVISRVGLMNASEGDCSDPGMVIRVM